MKERPILFNGAMVRALLDGSKTQTRRLANTGLYAINEEYHGIEVAMRERAAMIKNCPFGQVGDQLWVRETFSDVYGAGGDQEERLEHVMYRADGDTDPYVIGGRWTPSIHMPRWASRIQLEITGVRVERLTDISEEDAKAEGVKKIILPKEFPQAGRLCFEGYENKKQAYRDTAIDSFRSLWNSTGGNWEDNPWVWVIEFKRAAA